MRWPTKVELDHLLEVAKSGDPSKEMSVEKTAVIYLIENLDRLTGEVRELADRIEATRKERDAQKSRAKRWKRRYATLANQQEQPSE